MIEVFFLYNYSKKGHESQKCRKCRKGKCCNGLSQTVMCPDTAQYIKSLWYDYKNKNCNSKFNTNRSNKFFGKIIKHPQKFI